MKHMRIEIALSDGDGNLACEQRVGMVLHG